MFQNVKVDIIYYKTHTDFEMEFNLCGCCRMRLLTDKSPDRKTAVHALARAVSRSKVIIMIGSLFGDDGIIKLCAGAISKEITKADNNAYGISGNEEINIIKGSTPLVTPEGYFGGCIIESGPQTMILLSDNKNVRKSIMNTLIHPYIKELCAMELKENAQTVVSSEIPAETLDQTAAPVVTEEIVEETLENAVVEETETDDEIVETIENTVTEEDDEIEETEIVEEPVITDEFPQDTLLQQAVEDDFNLYYEEENQNTEIVAEETGEEENFDGLIFSVEEEYYQNPVVEIADDDTQSSGFFTETEDITMQSAQNELTSLDDTSDEFISNEDEEYEGINEFEDIEDDEEYEEFLKMQRAKALNTPIAIVAIILLLLIAVVSYCIFYVPAKDGIEAADYLREIYTTLFS